MPISSAGHLSSVTSTSYPALVSYLASNYNAQRISSWSVSIRILKSSLGKSNKSMYVVHLSEFPSETFIMIEDGEKDTRASMKARLAVQKQQDVLMNEDNAIASESLADASLASAPVPTSTFSDKRAQLKASLQTTSTRFTLFTTSSHFPLLLSRLNLPPPLGAPSMGDGASNTQTTAGPGAWLPRGAPIVIEGATYELPSATSYGVEEIPHKSNCEWRVRLGMMQSGGTRSSGAIVENEYMPLLRITDPTLLLSHLQNLFPSYLTNPIQNNTTNAIGGIFLTYPTTEQWEEVIPTSNESWCDDLEAPRGYDTIGWKGKERGRRLAYLYLTLLRNQGVL